MARSLPRFSRALAAHLESKRQPINDMVQRFGPILGDYEDPDTGETSIAGYLMQEGLEKAAEEGFRSDYPIAFDIRNRSNAQIYDEVTPKSANAMINSYRETRDNPTLKAKYGEGYTEGEQYDLRQAFANRRKYR